MRTPYTRAVLLLRFSQMAFIHHTAIFLLAGSLSAQIIYTDINDTILTFPPQTSGILDDSTNFFYFDLDQDGAADFYFSAHYWEEWYSPSASEYPHWVLNLSAMDQNAIPWEEACATDFAMGDTIQWYQWGTSAALYVDVLGFSTACNLPFEDRYFGLRLQQGGQNYYGWIRLDAATDTLVFKDFAYNSEAEGIILAGQASTAGAYERKIRDKQVWFDGNIMHINDDNLIYTKYTILSSAGQLVENKAINGRSMICLVHLPPGLYIVYLVGSKSHKALKVLIR